MCSAFRAAILAFRCGGGFLFGRLLCRLFSPLSSCSASRAALLAFRCGGARRVVCCALLSFSRSGGCAPWSPLAPVCASRRRLLVARPPAAQQLREPASSHPVKPPRQADPMTRQATPSSHPVKPPRQADPMTRQATPSSHLSKLPRQVTSASYHGKLPRQFDPTPVTYANVSLVASQFVWFPNHNSQDTHPRCDHFAPPHLVTL